MCGIVGYSGDKAPEEILIQGLKKLEYRGYDSAGIAVLGSHGLKRVRSEGKLARLSDRLVEHQFDGHIGIGHTRWATHGAPSESNAHPHMADGVCIVHNGIIENYQEIREELAASGVTFTSETDSELIAHLIAEQLKVTHDLRRAVDLVQPQLRGAFSVLAVWTEQPDKIIGFKFGPPLILGLGKDELHLASDLQALLPFTQDVVYFDDGDMVEIDGSSYQFYSANGVSIEKEVVSLDMSAEDVEKANFPHFMLKEIYEQPQAVAQTLKPHIDLRNRTIHLYGIGFGKTLGKEDLGELDDWSTTQEWLHPIERVFIVACGTSYYAAMVGKYYFEKLAGVPVEVDIASEFRYRDPVVPANSLFITISQSGETADTLAALRLVSQRSDVTTLSISNSPLSSIDREAQGHFYLHCGAEIGVASTKAFVSTLVGLQLWAMAMGKVKGKVDSSAESELVEGLLALPSQMEGVLAYDKFFAEASETLRAYRGFLYMARGVNFPIALEGALKLKELAYMHAEGYAAGEMKHGPLALIDERMVVVMIAPQDELYEKTASNLEEARARGAQVIAIGTGQDRKLVQQSQHYLSLPVTHPLLNPLLAVIPLQLMAYHLADNLGLDVDQPRNLAKSVTVE